MNDRKIKSQAEASFSEPSEEMVALYQEHVPVYLSDLRAAIGSDDEKLVQFHAHKMSSAMKTMGFMNISDLLDEIQKNKLEGKELSEVAQKIEKLVEHTLVLMAK